MRFLTHPLPFLLVYCLLQGINSLWFQLNGYEVADILRWTWIDWLKNAWLGMGIAVLGAFISFFDQKFSRWMQDQNRNGPKSQSPTANSQPTTSNTP